MSPIPVALIALLVVGLGAFMMRKYLRNEKRHPLMIGAHIILAILTLESMVVLIQRNLGDVKKGETAALLVGGALFAALVSAVLRGREATGAKPLFFLHSLLGTVGVITLLLWAAST